MTWVLVALVAVSLVAVAVAMFFARRAASVGAVSRTDRVTACLNEHGLRERLEAEVAVGVRHGQPAAIVRVELVERAREPAPVRWAAARLAGVVRPGDVVGRLEGGAFVLLLPATVKLDADAVADRAREALAERAAAATAVAGYPQDGVDAESLLRHAEGELHPLRRLDPESAPATASLAWATAFANAQDKRVTARHDHSWMVGEHAAAVAWRLGWDGEDVAALRLAACLHDVGKVAVPDRVLAKPGPLTPTEFLQMAEHPVVGARLLARIDGMEQVAEWVLHSHEHFDGSGYPDGLTGSEIPQASRILHVADAFDAMTAPRPHQLPLSLDDALAELRRHAGTQFDPEVVRVFDAYVAEMRAADGGGGDEAAGPV
jgi:putative nucleotidyltransferase with HDIG domain